MISVMIDDIPSRQSYGGFMAAKVVEANAGIHSLAMSVAVSPFEICCCV